MEVEAIDRQRMLNHLECEFENADLPGIVHSFDHRFGRIPKPAGIVEDPITHDIHRIVNDFLRDLATAEAKAIPQECEILSLGTELLDQRVHPLTGLIPEAFELDLLDRVRPQDSRPQRLNLTTADTDLPRAVHQLAEQLELEPRVTEGIDPAIWLHQHLRRLQRVLNIVR